MFSWLKWHYSCGFGPRCGVTRKRLTGGIATLHAGLGRLSYARIALGTEKSYTLRWKRVPCQRLISENLLILLQDRPYLESIRTSSNFRVLLFLQDNLNWSEIYQFR